MNENPLAAIRDKIVAVELGNAPNKAELLSALLDEYMKELKTYESSR